MGLIAVIILDLRDLLALPPDTDQENPMPMPTEPDPIRYQVTVSLVNIHVTADVTASRGDVTASATGRRTCTDLTRTERESAEQATDRLLGAELGLAHAMEA